MKGKMKNRLALLSVLLIAGLLIAGIGTALGAGDLLKFGEKTVIGTVTTNEDGTQTVTIREDGKVVKEVTLPEKEGYAINIKGSSVKGSSDGQIVISQVPKEEIQENCNKPGFNCTTEDSGEMGVSCFINGQQMDPANCPKP